MKKSILSILFLSIISICYSQNDPEEILKFSVSSPQSFEMTRYAGSPINEYTGKASASIPIFSYKSRLIEIPLSLNYIGNGVKINQNSSWTGINWNLSAGGVITRQVMDVPDEKSNRYFLEDIDALDGTEGDGLNYQNGDDDVVQVHAIIDNAGSYTYDTQIDIFSFNFLGISGKFYLDRNCDFTEPCAGVLTKNDQSLSIRFLKSNTSEIIITDSSGKEYYFGGAQSHIEESAVTQKLSRGVYEPTAFYLKKIIDPMGDSVYFDYSSVDYDYQMSMDQQKQYVTSKTIDVSSPDCPGCKDLTSSLSTQTTTKTYNKIIGAKFLERIHSPNSSMEMQFVNTPSSLETMPLKLSKILLLDTFANTIINEVTLNYAEFNSKRFFLNKVIFGEVDHSNSFNGNKVYDLIYDNPSNLPAPFSFSQDFLGYYNGKQNATLIPKTTHPEFIEDYQSFADRTADFSFAKRGSLKKIIYPTGGETEFEYEATKDLKDEFQFHYYTLWDNSPNNEIPCDKTYQEVLLGVPEFQPDGTVSENEINSEQEIEFNYNVFAKTGRFQHQDKVTIELRDYNTNTLISSHIRALSQDDTEYSNVALFTIYPGNQYKVSMRFTSNTIASTCNDDQDKIEINGNFRVKIGEVLVDAPGLRVKRKIDRSPEGQDEITRYYYNSVDKYQDQFSGSKKLNFVTVYRSKFIDCCLVFTNSGGQCELVTPNYSTNLYNLIHNGSNTLGANLSDFDGQFTFPKVTVSLGGDNFEKGGYEMTFEDVGNPGAVSYFGITATNMDYKQQHPTMRNFGLGNSGMYDGTMISKKDILKKNDELYFLNKAKNLYSRDNLESVSSVIGARLFADCFYIFTSTENINLSFYTTFSKRTDTITSVNTAYIDPLPILEVDDSTYKKIITEQKTINHPFYGGLVSEIITSTSKPEEFNVQKLFYPVPEDLLAISPVLNPYNTNIYQEGLYEQHRLSTPIQQENWRRTGNNDERLSLKRIFYDSINGHLNVSKVGTIKGENSDFEYLVEILSYDNFGRPKEYKHPYGPTNLIIWRNDNKVKRILKNCTLAEYTQALSNVDINDALIGYEGSCIDIGNPDLRDDLPNALITDYFYKRFGGICSIINPNGQETGYTYDAFNQLKSIVDQDGNLLELYRYNYKNN
ncbi:hypothetical protein KZY98_09945 [Croceibacter atlanticus]|uniref:RHS repeat domain-containing protein n=1 Tax=Croceibacter atlanticus TaxID=313588 RepID=UPI001C5DD640|nr:RHS repeat domain-containing protein [Croceibacter atlanticus]MBW4970779.1 hypothetical protein [Croceibacter atlanticus]